MGKRKIGRIGEGIRFPNRNPENDLGDTEINTAKWRGITHLSPFVSYSAYCYVLHRMDDLKVSSFAAKKKKSKKHYEIDVFGIVLREQG